MRREVIAEHVGIGAGISAADIDSTEILAREEAEGLLIVEFEVFETIQTRRVEPGDEVVVLKIRIGIAELGRGERPRLNEVRRLDAIELPYQLICPQRKGEIQTFFDE